MSEQERIRWLIERIRDGYGWHGWDMDKLLEDVTAAEAATTVVPGTHTIWQIVEHAIAWRQVATRRIEGRKVAGPSEQENWPVTPDASESAWAATKAELEASRTRFVEAMIRLPATRLNDNVPGEAYTFLDMLYGVLHHDLYHAGQVAVVRNAVRARAQS